MGPNTIGLCFNIPNGNGTMENIKSTSIVLIPQGLKPISMVDFQSTSLHSVIYKSIVKTVANWREGVLNLISFSISIGFHTRLSNYG